MGQLKERSDLLAASHVDGKNVPGSYSALIIFETGAPFCGAFYMLPQYRKALDRPLGWRAWAGPAEVGMARLAADLSLSSPTHHQHRAGDCYTWLH